MNKNKLQRFYTKAFINLVHKTKAEKQTLIKIREEKRKPKEQTFKDKIKILKENK